MSLLSQNVADGFKPRYFDLLTITDGEKVQLRPETQRYAYVVQLCDTLATGKKPEECTNLREISSKALTRLEKLANGQEFDAQQLAEFRETATALAKSIKLV